MERYGFGGSSVLESIQPVIARSKWILFHPDRLEPAVGQWGHMLPVESTWERPCHYFDGTEKTVRWIFVLDVLNHCFWPDKGDPTWTIAYQGEPYSGYWGLAASLKRAVEEGFPVTDAHHLEHISPRDLACIFSGEGEMPLFEERLANLRESGRVIRTQWGGDVVHLVERAGGSAMRLVHLVTESFPSFRDQAVYEGKTVFFWKRAQIFAADLYLAFGGKSWGQLNDIEQLTAFADYKLPQVLRELGIISYDPSLARRVDSYEYLKSGSPEEVEIRAMTIWVVEALREKFRQAGRNVNSMQVDNWLWQLGQIESFRQRRYHRCRTIYY